MGGNPDGGTADLILLVKSASGTEILSDTIHFYPFSSIVIGLSGEDLISSFRADTGGQTNRIDVVSDPVEQLEAPDAGIGPQRSSKSSGSGGAENSGMYLVSRWLLIDGYDVHYYDEDAVDSVGSGQAFDEVMLAVKDLCVTSIAIFGHSHGGGSTYSLAEKFTENNSANLFTVKFTAYVDAIENESNTDMNSEARLPPGTEYHINYFQ